MNLKEFKFSDKTISIERKENLSSSYKIKSYKVKFKFMEDKKIP